MPAPPWAAAYVGLPFLERGRDRAGLDCWGLLALVMHERFHVAVPSFAEAYKTGDDVKALSALLAGELPTQPWRRIGLGVLPAPGDAALLRIEGYPAHVGIVVEPPWFLHIFRGANVVLDRLNSLRWTRRTLGVYRHAALDTARG